MERTNFKQRDIKKSLLTILFMMIILISCLLATSDNGYAEEIITSGSCGSGVTWELSDEGTLTIAGIGRIPSCQFSCPWRSYRDSIKKVFISEGVTSIGDYAFYNCGALTSIEIPKSVENIWKFAFYDCTSLTSINIPEGVTSIENYTFYDCTSLASINIPEGVTSIGEKAFNGCSALTSINIPEGVTSIGENAFNGCSSLTSATIPEGVTKIENDTFFNCSNLASINIPEGVTSIGNYAFSRCSALTSIIIPEGVTSIGGSAFNGCSALTSIIIPEGVTSIGDYTFRDCTSLASISIPDGVTSIGDYAFFMTYVFRRIEIIIPDSVTSIGKDAFGNIDKSAIKYSKGSYADVYFNGITNQNENDGEKIPSDDDYTGGETNQNENLLSDESSNHSSSTGTVTEISTAEQLYNVRNNLSGNYILIADIDLSAATSQGGEYYNNGEGWDPIGGSTGFTGTFDGNGHTIYGLKTANEGLFYSNEGTIKNLTLKDGLVGSYLKSNWDMGGLCGSNSGTIESCTNGNDVFSIGSAVMDAGGIAGYNSGSIINCINTGEIRIQGVSNSTIGKTPCAGGIAGKNIGTILGGNNSAAITANTDIGTTYAGGIAGKNEESGTSNKCSNSGDVTSLNKKRRYNEGIYAGGITGYTNSTIEESFNSGMIISFGDDETYSGGICGYANNASFTKCHNEGIVISGTEDSEYSAYSAGIIACFENSEGIVISDSSNSGSISSTSTDSVFSGGIVGLLGQGAVIHCNNSSAVNSSCKDYALTVTAGGLAAAVGEIGQIVESYNTGLVSAFSERSSSLGTVCAGGIAGFTNSGSHINQCYSIAMISSSDLIGGLVGQNSGGINDCYYIGTLAPISQSIYGGAVGRNYKGSIYNVYCLTEVSGSGKNGGLLIGSNEGTAYGSLISYDDGAHLLVKSGTSVGKALTLSKMKTKTSYSSFDFNNVWTMGTGSYNLPILRNCADYSKQNNLKINVISSADNTKSGTNENASTSTKAQMGTDGTALGAGASAEAANKAITSAKGDKDIKGSIFNKLRLKQSKVSKTSITVSWTKVKNAKKYVVYAGISGKSNKMQKMTTTAKTKYTLKKFNKKTIAKGKYYKFAVVALDSKGKVITSSKYCHIATLGKNAASNPSKITTKAIKNKVTIKVKKTFKLAGSYASSAKKYKIKKILGMRYESTNTKVATVTSKGVIKGVKKGTCYIYAYAQNGIFERIKVTVK